MEFANNAHAYVLKASSCSKLHVRSSVSSITYDECLLTGLDSANRMYADGPVTVICVPEMMRSYSDVNTNNGPRLASL